ncbi:hypothetical protein B566_EDAN000629 [Ephemera danica]|nr:hypothetical protein B566_EDAN000629 [Ephemera danica]
MIDLITVVFHICFSLIAVIYEKPRKILTMTTKNEILAEYSQAVAQLREESRRRGMTNSEVDDLVSASLETVVPKTPQEYRAWNIFSIIWWLMKALLLAALLYAVVACHSPTQKSLSRHIQGYIYPFMRGLRKLTLPILRAYPDLTEWHEEPCLVRNPFYGFRGPDCWPCDGVRSVLVLDVSPKNFIETFYHNGQPFVIQSGGGRKGPVEVSWIALQLLQQNNADLLQKSAPRVLAEGFSSSSVSLATLLSISERNISELYPNAHLTWPHFVPTHTEVAIQRYVFIDSPAAPSYHLPLTDFANIWVSQGSGTRLLALVPSPHCSQRCHPVSVLLQQGDLLFYNWQFWRPRSLPLQGSSSLSVTFVGSFY